MIVAVRRTAMLVVVATSLALTACAAEEPTAVETPAATAEVVPSPAPSAGGLPLPKGFPSADIPLLEGDLVVANELSSGWSIFVASNDLPNDFAAASDLLVAVGFERTVTNSDDEKYFAAFTGAKHQVQLSASIDPTYGSTLVYTINTPTEEP